MLPRMTGDPLGVPPVAGAVVPDEAAVVTELVLFDDDDVLELLQALTVASAARAAKVETTSERGRDLPILPCSTLSPLI